jgi:CBS domain-containing protein
MAAAGGRLTVGEIMTAQVTTLAPESSLLDAVNLFAECGFRHILVLDANGALAGVLSDRDALRFMARTRDAKGTVVASIMTREPATATRDMAVVDAIDVVVFHRINCLPVVDEAGKVCGILTTTDLLGAFHNLLERLAPAAA